MAASLDDAAQLAVRAYEVPKRDVRVRRGETVTSRKRPELDALGVRVGTFLVYPKLSLEENYSDNIFADADNEVSDFITRILPSLRIDSDWGNHAVSLEGGADVGRYLDNTDENFEDYHFSASGRVDVRRSTKVRARVRYRALHSDRGSPDDERGVEPTQFDIFSVGVNGFHNFGRVNVTLGGTFDKYDFDDVATSDPARPFNNDDRDRNEVEASLRLAYEIVPQYEAFVRGAYNIRDYDSAEDDNERNRDSDGFDVVAGVEIDFGGIVFGDFFAGYKIQNFDDPDLDTVQGPTVGADITWTVTPLTTVVGRVSRQIRETTRADASGRFLSSVGLSVDHELRRDLLIGADARFLHDKFEGRDRTDLIYQAGVNIKYMLSRYFYVSGGYDFRMREGESSTDDFAENNFLIRLQAQF
ncbi:MAG: outer membrane beta-barrel protein [Alphaproteobacteria bacterium]|nr:outer membrane beta-barrel protein [Alphaproteobacteria bacterium]